MAKISLAVKYRPKEFDDLTEQGVIKDILENQINTDTIKNAYLFTGPAGTGKTTSARIFANMINDGIGNPIEIDAASNSGVDNIRSVIDDAKRKPLSGKYKVFIVDECHSLSSGAWQAMLKLLEEPPKFSIFILATTDPQKIPNTILSRVQRFQFTKISKSGIVERLKNICNAEIESGEKITYTDDAIEHIAKISSGGMRDAITLMDKCLSLSPNINLENVLQTVGGESYELFYNLLSSLCEKNNKSIDYIERVYNAGKDLKQFMKEFAKYILDVEKCIIYGGLEYTNIPNTESNIEQMNNLTSCKNDVFDIMELIVSINSKVKWENDAKTLIELEFLLFCGGASK